MNDKKTNYDEFITIYNELDNFLRKELNVESGVTHSHLIREMAKKNRIISRYSNELLTYAKLRNIIVHNPDKRHAHPIADPHGKVVEKYKRILLSILRPPKAIDTIAIKRENIYTASLNDSALEVMQTMNKNTYTHVPIIEEEKLIGVFSENTIFSYIVKTGDVLLERNFKIKEFLEFIHMDKHESESFAFVSREALVYDVEQMFADQLQDGKRLAVVFLTHSGSPDEKILGMVTAWDVAGYKED